ncbi:hypothetical protein GLAREA_09186 [Glarea lozoyensis ATCC 20868]|uniref:DUF7053 domain-containing protein n=1 Tax=Glarea lozoyensis (strain ATCC 20868 / MF5171) TaxID=1116229 RepID=S3EFR1_GLAL2|nr:uncharacterized protein GLAREA_09186 [Glarea lozoyensis ATCC 20868]EPE37023.1 hypothetical protein GLAREA_09186 [Glarea lozoyensis ATCC 20868]
MISYTLVPATSSPPNTKSYRVINDMPQIPKAVHDAKVTIEIELTDFENGVEALVHAPLGIVQKGDWKIEGKEGELVLVVKMEISCSRLLMGITKGKAESNHPLMGNSFKEVLKTEELG